jgi:hypothetical protein
MTIKSDLAADALQGRQPRISGGLRDSFGVGGFQFFYE